GKQVETAQVQGGASSTVGLIAPRDLAVTVPLGMGGVLGARAGGNAPAMKVRYDGPIKAPIKAGDHIADLIVTPEGLAPQVMPLVAANDVAEAGFFGRIWASIKALFGFA
ncbi:MAG TPA: D-alanyl-D-alanine carboxypeptidase, partial [Sphingomonas sp.]